MERVGFFEVNYTGIGTCENYDIPKRLIVEDAYMTRDEDCIYEDYYRLSKQRTLLKNLLKEQT